MQNDHHWLQMRNMRRMEEKVRVRLRRRIVSDRSNPFEGLAEEEFLLRFRLSKECVLNLLQNITEQLPIAADTRGCPIPQHLQVLIALRCMATGGHQLTISDCYGVSQTSVSKCLRTVTPTICTDGKGLCEDANRFGCNSGDGGFQGHCRYARNCWCYRLHTYSHSAANLR
ncbi:hypothetical protein Pmani_018401 [Petrolisthes manimaculis]|uniref:Nuclease HARBI1 n=1 Tax=Petrolisthes manimaculis TaxID=1843537 RepID=A0AAE1PLK8_9EUCA|nr:hypothetical protein Pmani_018401 [Petrolisthes manimaculis]